MLEDESEGVDVWDLDNGRAPGIKGQLHVIQADVDIGVGDDGIDKLYFHHYTGNIYVDKNYSGGNGKIDTPFSTVANAYNYIITNSWYEARIKIKAGIYQESLQISSMPLQITGWQGTAKIGTNGQISISPSGAINLFNKSKLATY
jgi:pectin methylesterase-like acyl-CoA thioesterase